MTADSKAAGPKTDRPGDASTTTVPQHADTLRARVRRQWLTIVVYLVANTGTMWAAAWTVATRPDELVLGVLLTAAATGNTVCSIVGITRLVRP